MAKTTFDEIIRHWKLALTFNPKQYWTEKGLTYVREYPPEGSRGEELILATLAKFDFQSLVDIGCGYGRYLKAIADRFPDVKLAGVDISPTQIVEAKKFLSAYPVIDLRETDGLHLPYPDKSFDVSFTYGCMIHVPPRAIRPFFKEVYRITRYKGVFLESSRNRLSAKRLLSPSVVWYSHNYSSLFRSFHRPHEINEDWQEQRNGIVGRMYIVDFASCELKSE
jgi:SAM-dependent methyltransferase